MLDAELRMTPTATFAPDGPRAGAEAHGASPRWGRGGWLAALLLLLGASAARAADPVEGLIVQIPTSIGTESTNQLRSLLHGPLQRFNAGRGPKATFRILCDFNPENRRSECENFGACYDLATYLRSLQTSIPGVQTVAYVHGVVRRHSVLPVLACGEIILSRNPEARLGDVAGPDNPLRPTESTGYDDVTRNRYAPALIRKMYDPNVAVVRVGDRYLEAGEVKPGTRAEPVPELARGEPGVYTFDLGRKVGLCQQAEYNTLDEVRVAYGLPRTALQRSLDRTVCWRIPVEGVINGELLERTKRRIDRALRGRATLLVLELQCGDGESEKAYELGLYLAGLKERNANNPVKAIAYVTNSSRNTAAFLAFGCDKIVMQREIREGTEVVQKGATLGDFQRYLDAHPSLEPTRKRLAALRRRNADPARQDALEKELREGGQALEKTLRTNLADLAVRQSYPAVLAEGMLSRDLRIHLVESTAGSSARTVMSEEELSSPAQLERWRSVRLVKPAGGKPNDYLTLTAEQALDLGVASYLVKDFPGLCEAEGVNPTEVRQSETDWLDRLADFLRDPWTSVVLVMLGITCLILELKMPGVGLPGVIAAICFVLFFWSHSQLNGQITWLAILLFVLGLLLIGLEVFVLPGFGVAGISGILLVLASLGLVAYGHWPRTSQEWIAFGHKISPFGISMLGALVVVALLAHYLPHIPILNRLMLKPAEDVDPAAEAALDHPAHAELAALLGAIGVAATPLRPAGKTQFGDAFVDVVAEGGYIMPGTRVQVIEVEGNRVVVKEV